MDHLQLSCNQVQGQVVDFCSHGWGKLSIVWCAFQRDALIPQQSKCLKML